MVLLATQLRVAAKCLMVQRAHPLMHIRHRDSEHFWARSFSQSSSRKASEDPASLFSHLQASPLVRQLANKPEALQAVNDFGNLLKESGLSFSPENPPTKMQLLKLAMNPTFRESAKRVMDELKKAGIEINPENAFEFLGLKKPGQ